MANQNSSSMALASAKDQVSFLINGSTSQAPVDTRALDEWDRYLCRWDGCDALPSSSSPADLLSHIRSTHLDPLPAECSWGNCQHAPFTLSHLLTHLPLGLDYQPVIRDVITTHPSITDDLLSSPHITSYPPAPLSSQYTLQRKGMSTATDSNQTPVGAEFLAALIIRNLAKYLKTEIASSLPLTEQGREERKRHLVEERFGLPIPDKVLREEEEEEEKERGGRGGGEEEGLDAAQRERAKRAFQVVEGRIGEVVEMNVSGLGQYLVEAMGW